MPPRPLAVLAVVALLGAACSPTLDWRDVRPEGSGATLLLPCRPHVQARSVQLAGHAVRLVMHACSAGDATWALAFADMGDPVLVGPALQELQRSAAANLGAAAARPLPLAVPAATPHPASARIALDVHLPDGTAVLEQVAVFTRGTWVFQATVIGPHLAADGVDTFFGSLRAGP